MTPRLVLLLAKRPGQSEAPGRPAALSRTYVYRHFRDAVRLPVEPECGRSRAATRCSDWTTRKEGRHVSTRTLVRRLPSAFGLLEGAYLELLILQLAFQLLGLGHFAHRLVEVVLIDRISVILDGKQAAAGTKGLVRLCHGWW